MDQHKTSTFDIFSNIVPSDDNDELGEQITLLSARMNAATYQIIKLIAVFDQRDGWYGAGLRSCAHWLNWRCGLADSAARERVRVARCLGKLPQINTAFASGEISYSKVRAMTRVATDENEEFLLMIAHHGTANHMEQLVRKYQRVEKNIAMEEEDPQVEQRSLIRYQDNDGMWLIYARLPQEEGGLLVNAIEEVMTKQDKMLPVTRRLALEKLKLEKRARDKNVSAETFSAKQAAEQSAEQASSDEDILIGPEIVETATFAQKRADALSAIAEHYIASASGEGSDDKIKSLAGHERCQVVLHVDVKTLKHDHDHGCGCDHDSEDATSSQQHTPPPHLDKQWISLENAKRLSCDASLLTVLEDGQGDVLNLGRNTRVVSPLLRRALDIRDETCRYPGCCQSRYVDFHHIEHWANGGETKAPNLVKLCRFHHRELHKGHFTIEIQERTVEHKQHKQHKQEKRNKPVLIFRTFRGNVMEANPKPPLCTAKDYFEQQWPDIDSHTGDSRWLGETMDYGMAVDGILYCKEKANSSSRP